MGLARQYCGQLGKIDNCQIAVTLSIANHAASLPIACRLYLPDEAWRTVSWREGSNETLSSRFAAMRIRPASRDWKHAAPHPLEWLAGR